MCCQDSLLMSDKTLDYNLHDVQNSGRDHFSDHTPAVALPFLYHASYSVFNCTSSCTC